LQPTQRGLGSRSHTQSQCRETVSPTARSNVNPTPWRLRRACSTTSGQGPGWALPVAMSGCAPGPGPRPPPPRAPIGCGIDRAPPVAARPCQRAAIPAMGRQRKHGSCVGRRHLPARPTPGARRGGPLCVRTAHPRTRRVPTGAPGSGARCPPSRPRRPADPVVRRCRCRRRSAGGRATPPRTGPPRAASPPASLPPRQRRGVRRGPRGRSSQVRSGVGVAGEEHGARDQPPSGGDVTAPPPCSGSSVAPGDRCCPGSFPPPWAAG